MTDPRNIYYPSGKPLCIYEDGKQIQYLHIAKTKQISSITVDGRFTGEREVRNLETGNLIKKKSFFKNSSKDGIVEVYGEDGKVEESNYFEILGEYEYTYADTKKTKLTAIGKLDKDTNALIRHTSFYTSTSIKSINTNDKNSLPKCVEIFVDTPSNRHKAKIYFSKGAPDVVLNYSPSTGNLLQTSKFKDASSNDFVATRHLYNDKVAKQLEKNNNHRIVEFKNGLPISSKTEREGLPIEEISYNQNGLPMQQINRNFYHGKKKPMIKIYTANAWNEQKEMLSGHFKHYDAHGSIVQSANFINNQKKFELDGHAINRDLSIETIESNIVQEASNDGLFEVQSGSIVYLENGNAISEKFICRTALDSQGELKAFNNLADRPQSWQLS